MHESPPGWPPSAARPSVHTHGLRPQHQGRERCAPRSPLLCLGTQLPASPGARVTGGEYVSWCCVGSWSRTSRCCCSRGLCTRSPAGLRWPCSPRSSPGRRRTRAPLQRRPPWRSAGPRTRPARPCSPCLAWGRPAGGRRAPASGAMLGCCPSRWLGACLAQQLHALAAVGQPIQRPAARVR